MSELSPKFFQVHSSWHIYGEGQRDTHAHTHRHRHTRTRTGTHSRTHALTHTHSRTHAHVVWAASTLPVHMCSNTSVVPNFVAIGSIPKNRKPYVRQTIVPNFVAIGWKMTILFKREKNFNPRRESCQISLRSVRHVPETRKAFAHRTIVPNFVAIGWKMTKLFEKQEEKKLFFAKN